MSGVWVFGYGSLVSPESFGHTLGRGFERGVDFHPAVLRGYGRRWNYGVMSFVGRSEEPDGSTREWSIVALGLEASSDETVNGVIGWVTDDELPSLDARERNYDRVDVTDLTEVAVVPSPVEGRIVTYVPQPAPIEYYRAARDRGEAAVEQRYWDLVDGAFADLGPGEQERYRTSTPPPDIPIVAMHRDGIPARHQVRKP
ncbi:MAG: gamma-glutamylcyclotransferase [Ilumatobacter sp.]|nr:gamma-glutamylcyclotransferase [Ilumatobacter sp.]